MPPCLTHINLNSEEELFARRRNRIRPEEIYQIVPEARRPKARKLAAIRKPAAKYRG